MLLVLSFSQAPVWGWLDARTLGALLGAFSLIAAFAYNETRVARPLVPLSIFRIRNVTGGNLIVVATYVGAFGLLFLFTLYVQNVLGFSPFRTGLAFLPFPLILGFMSTQIAGLVARFGYRRFRILGPLVMSAGLLWLARLPVSGNYVTDLLPSLILMSLGMGLTMMPTIAAATSGVPTSSAGLASGLVATSQQVGGAFGIAVLSGIVITIAGMSAARTPVAQVKGSQVAFFVAALFTLSAAAIATWVIREPQAEEPPLREPVPLSTETCPYSCNF
jgi:hypothetical protein